MAHDASKDLLRSLCLAAGPPGAEDEVRRIVAQNLSDVGPKRFDRLGSLICEKEGSREAPRIVLDSHLDEVGFMVQSISGEGRLAFVTVGGWWAHVLLGQRVEIITNTGRVPGVIGAKPPHFLSKAERDKVLEIESMYIDVGASDRAEVEALGLRIGDPVVPHSEFIETAIDGVMSCKAFDNRAGVGLMCETLRALTDRDHPNTVIGVAAVQEEVGCRGAITASELTRADVAIVLECAPADDLPGFTERQAVLGGGPQVRFFDPTAISNRRLVHEVRDTAESLGVPIQLAVRRSGGTNASSIQRSGSGVPTVVIGVPARYIHTHAALMQWRDYCSALQLVTELVMRLDKQTVDELTRFEQESD
jgi:endoglucanase